MTAPRKKAIPPSALHLRRLGIDTYQEAVLYVREDCPVCRSEGFNAQSRVRVDLNGHTAIATLDVVKSDILGPGEASRYLRGEPRFQALMRGGFRFLCLVGIVYTLAGGVQRDWAQGLDTIKVAINRNMRTHRVELSVKPLDGLELSVDYYHFTADTRNNLGGQPPVATYGTGHLGQEITPTLQWMVGQTLYIQALATFLRPGPALSQEGGGAIAVDPRDMVGNKAFNTMFLFDVEMPGHEGDYHVGGRVYIRFDHGFEPVVRRWHRGLRQLFLRRFNV